MRRVLGSRAPAALQRSEWIGLPVEGSDYLLTCAEVGVALAGFSALIVAVRQRGSEPLSVADRHSVTLLIERGLASTFLELLPIVLLGLEVSENTLWAASSATFVAYALSIVLRSLASRRDDPGTFPELVGGPGGFALLASGLAVIALQVLHALGIGVRQGPWWYAVGVTWLLASAAYLFYFVVRAWMNRAE